MKLLVRPDRTRTQAPRIVTGAYIHRIPRAEFISLPFTALVRWGICVATLFLSTSFLFAQNPIQVENAKAGTTSWQATNLADNEAGYSNVIEGYASLTSVNRGGQITFYVNVSTPGDSFTMNIYRMGWYGGTGARLVLSVPAQLGVQQPTPTTDSTTGLTECNWTPTYVLNLTSATDPVSNWVSGVYTVLLTDTTSGLQRYMVFVVRDDASTAKYFFQSAVNTYQAYNNYGGKSLYAFDSLGGNPATKVSFNRPYHIGYGYDGAGDFLTGWEYDAVRFLEREGYDVTYGTDLDAHENGSLLRAHQAILLPGHNEYWSMAMRTNVVAARDAGVSLGFFGGNVSYWQVRFEPSTVNSAADRTLVGYKDFAKSKHSPGPDPYYTACNRGTTADCPLVTVRWRDTPVSMPENAFVGIMWSNDPVNGDIKVTNTSNWVFNTTGLHDNDILPGLLGYEVDAIYSNGLSPAGLVTLAASPYTTTNGLSSGVANSTVYTAASGATVFASGSFQFAWGLDDFSQVFAGQGSLVSFGAQQMTRNLLARFIGDQPPVANAGGPYTGGSNQAIQFDGTNSSDPDGTVNAYEWDYGDGSAGTGSTSSHSYAHAGTYTVSLIVTDGEGSRNAATTTATITDQPVAGLSPISLNFGSQAVGAASTAQPVTLSNTGTIALTVTSIAATGDYSQTNDCGSSVAAGGSCTISVTFTPTATGTRTGTIVVTDNSNSVSGSTQTVNLTGVGGVPLAGVLPSSLSFGNQLVGTPSAAQPTVLSNTGGAALTIASISASGDYSQTNNCGGSVAAGGSCTINVTFTPSVAGPRPGTIVITDNDNAVNGSTQTVNLSGTGVAPVAGVAPRVLSFGIQYVGSTAPAQTVTVTNSGTAPLSISNFAASGDFAVAGSGTTCSTSSPLGINASCDIAVTFTPSAAGPRKSSVLITDSAAGSPHGAILTGMGTAASFSPGSLTFADQTTGTASTPSVIVLSNLGAVPMNIWQVAFLGPNASDFSSTSNCGTKLGAGSSCTISITFTPGAAGARAASLVVSDDGGGSPQSVPLAGNGVAPAAPVSSPAASTDISASTTSATPRIKPRESSPGASRRAGPVSPANGLSASSLSFGRQRVWTSGAPKSVVFTNAGNTAISIRRIEIFGSSQNEFSLTDDCGSELEAGKSCTLKVAFAPQERGERQVTISIEDGTEEGHHQVQVKGVGIQ